MPAPKVNIRTATNEDIPHFKIVVEQSIRILCKGYYQDDQIEALLMQYPPEALYVQWLNNRVLLVAELAHQVVGFAQLNPDKGYVEAVHVLPEFSGRGIGRLLLQELEKIANVQGVYSVLVDSSLNAVNFYSSCGYERLKDHRIRCNNGVELDTVLFQKSL